jgi:hypothetical protein
MEDKSNPEHDRFMAALASVLSASPEQIRDSEIQAKSEEPSPYKRWTYGPEAAKS